MLKIIQIIVLIQGVFLIFVLLNNRTKYKPTQFWLLVFCIISVLFYSIGDDEFNLFSNSTHWFLFDSSLFITFLFLFTLYFNSEKEFFLKKHYLFFIPNLIYFAIEVFELKTKQEPIYIEIPEFINRLAFLSYLFYTIYMVIKSKSKPWFIYFIIPITLILSIEFVDEILEYFKFNKSIFSEETTNIYFLLLVAILFYFIAFKFSNSSKNNLINKKLTTKYKTSNLNKQSIEKYKKALLNAMEKDKLYLDTNLSVYSLSEKLDIPRQYISEVLNVYMHIGFQDFINSYRVEAFIKYRQKEQYAHYTLLAIANEVGFNSKSSFNATFKKIKGLTPSQFAKTHAV